MSASLPELHRTTCDKWGQRTALRYKKWGRYQDLNWQEYRRLADSAAAGLILSGVQPGDRVAIFSENRYEWLIADHAVLSTGAADVPLHAPLTASQAEYQLYHSEACGIIIGGETQARKLREVIARLPHLEFIITFDPLTETAGLPRVWTWAGLLQRGRAAELGTEIMRREVMLTPESLATIIYTSGTTGPPKGVMLTHGNLVTNAESTAVTTGKTPDDILLSWLPYSHIYARTVDHYLTTSLGSVVCLAESLETLFKNLEETQPTWITAVPRFYEKVWGEIEPHPPEARLAELRRLFGPRIKQLTSGGAPLPRPICEGITAAGLPLLEGYGLTESSPVISFNSPTAQRMGSVGQAIPDVEVRIAEDGEILTRGPHVMRGYWRDPEATARTILDGWLLTGDVGRLDEDGFLYITDRKKDLLITSGGKNIAPSELERLLISDPLIDQAVVYGDRRPYVVALIVPNLPALEAEAARLGCPIETAGEFIITPQLVERVQAGIDRVMLTVSQPERVKRCLLLARPFKVAEDELTATLKVRRRFIVAKFEADLARLYDESLSSRS